MQISKIAVLVFDGSAYMNDLADFNREVKIGNMIPAIYPGWIVLLYWDYQIAVMRS